MSGATSGVDGVTGVRSIPAQVGRATAWTLSVVLVVGVVVWAWGAWGYRVMPLWYRAFGDRSISLADGAVLPTDGRTVAKPVLAERPVPTSAAIAAVTGAPVREVTVTQAASYVGFPMNDSSGDPATRYWTTPLGLVTYEPATLETTGGVPTLLVRTPQTGTDRPHYTTDAQRQALLRRLVDAWGLGASASASGESVLATRGVTGARSVRLLVVPAGTQLPPTLPSFSFGGIVGGDAAFREDGTLVMAWIPLTEVTGTHPVAAVSASQAFDALRHHADWTYAANGEVSVASARLVVASDFSADRIGAADPDWLFFDPTGQLVASVRADR